MIGLVMQQNVFKSLRVGVGAAASACTEVAVAVAMLGASCGDDMMLFCRHNVYVSRTVVVW
jgi:hypothetical protein